MKILFLYFAINDYMLLLHRYYQIAKQKFVLSKNYTENEWKSYVLEM